MSIKKHIPNTLTLMNLFFGCIAIVFAAHEHLVLSAIFMMFSLLFDFFDGFAARLLGVSSAIGKDLDSLADMVTFGVLPGFFMYYMLGRSTIKDTELFMYVPFLGFVITVFSGLRLAKFNNDTRQSDRFIGLPTPANSMLICSLGAMQQMNELEMTWLNNTWLLLALTAISSYLLIAELPLIALKFKSFAFSKNKFRYILLAVSGLLLVLLQIRAIPIVIVLYILLSIVDNIFSNTAAKS